MKHEEHWTSIADCIAANDWFASLPCSSYCRRFLTWLFRFQRVIALSYCVCSSHSISYSHSHTLVCLTMVPIFNSLYVCLLLTLDFSRRCTCFSPLPSCVTNFRNALLKSDQLRHEQLHKRAFYGFNEGLITFPPTFKVVQHLYFFLSVCILSSGAACGCSLRLVCPACSACVLLAE